MTLYDLAGNVLGTQRLDEQGFYAINIGSYLGGIVAMVSDGGINNVLDYFDEGMRAGKDLDAVLMAVEVVRSTNARVILNVNEATTAAAQLSGYNPNDGSGFVGGADPLATIELANAKVANVVQVTGSLTAADAQPLYNADGSLNGQMNMLGMFLASMSGMALLTPTTGDAIAAFAIGIQTSSTGPKLSDEAQAMVILGAVRSGISREEITNVLQPGSSDSRTDADPRRQPDRRSSDRGAQFGTNSFSRSFDGFGCWSDERLRHRIRQDSQLRPRQWCGSFDRCQQNPGACRLHGLGRCRPWRGQPAHGGHAQHRIGRP
jgi:hypothetical protein